MQLQVFWARSDRASYHRCLSLMFEWTGEIRLHFKAYFVTLFKDQYSVENLIIPFVI